MQSKLKLSDINKTLLTICAYNFLDMVKINYTTIENIEKTISEHTITKYLSIIDRASLEISTENKDLIFSASCLLHELYSKKFPLLEGYLRTIFLRLSLPPSALTIQNKKENFDELPIFFDELPSFFDELILGKKISEEHAQMINGRIRYLTTDQKDIWQSLNNPEMKSVIISAPTSAGKSFLISEYLTKKYIEVNKFLGIYIVPTLSLINQVCHDLRSAAKNSKLNILTHVPDDFLTYHKEKNSNKTILVLTQEKGTGLLYSIDHKTEWDCVIFDEIHNILRNEKENDELDSRAILYKELVENFYDNHSCHKFILAGPNINDNLDEMETIFEIKSPKKIKNNSAPVLKIIFSFAKDDDGKFKKFNAYILTKENIYTTLQLTSNQNLTIKNIGGENIRVKIIETHHTATILSLASSRSTTQTASKGNKLPKNGKLSQEAHSLKEYLANILSCKIEELDSYGFCIESGSVLHNSTLPSHIRLCIEIATKNGLIRSMITTSTLLQGMNFPIKYLIAKDAENYSITKNNTNVKNKQLKFRKPFSQTQFKNLLGRSGRLMKDLVGYGIIFDEDQTKQDLGIATSLGEGLQQTTMEENFQDLLALEVLENQRAIKLAKSSEFIGNSNDTLRIKQKACILRRYTLKYNNFNTFQKKLAKRGFDISQQDFFDIKSILSSDENIIAIILKQHTFFDPLDMPKMIAIYDNNFVIKNDDILNKKDNILSLSYYLKAIWNITLIGFSYHLGSKFDKVKFGNSINYYIGLACGWCYGTSWKDLWKANSNKNLKEFGDDLNIISFNFPQLLKPWLDIYQLKTGKESYILGALEHGLIEKEDKSKLQKGYHRELILELKENNYHEWTLKQKNFLDGIL